MTHTWYVPGVVEARVTRLDRLDRAPQTVKPPVMAVFGPHEYPSVDNAPAGQYGKITFRLGFAS